MKRLRMKFDVEFAGPPEIKSIADDTIGRHLAQ